MKRHALLVAALMLSAALPTVVFAQDAAAPAQSVAMHGIAMHGAPKYAPDFSHLDYVNPDAPKGGTMRLAIEGTTIDNLNPFTIKGVAAPGIGMTFDTLLSSTEDEAFSEYGMLAQSVEMPEDRSWVVFNLRPEAKFSDGTPVTADDVVFTFKALMEKGAPFYRAYYANVKDAVAETPARVKFTFDMAGNRELPLIMGQMPVLSKKDWEGKDIGNTTLKPVLGSGAYKVKEFVPNRRITFERVQDWWGANLPLNKGRNNFDTITYDLYRDSTVLLQAFFAGEYDFRAENMAKAWNTEYNTPAIKQGLIKKEEIHHEIPTGMQGFIFNIRRPLFADAKVREAIGYAFDFEWSNKQFAAGKYVRTDSYFENSELASSGVPQGRELEILETFRSQLPDALFTQEFRNPVTNGSGPAGHRANLARAKKLLEEAGWKVGKSGMLEKDGKPFKFEFLLYNNTFDKWIGPFVENLKKLGIECKLRIVDTAQYQNRTDDFDYDMTIENFGQSLSPGNEQRDFWSSAKADVKGSRNAIGIKSPVVDTLVDMIISAPDREELIVRTHALDRVLLWGHYIIPNWHINYHRVAYWDKFGRPDVTPKYGLGVPDTWWYDTDKAAKVADKAKPESGKK